MISVFFNGGVAAIFIAVPGGQNEFCRRILNNTFAKNEVTK
jgi:hypothetical protein